MEKIDSGNARLVEELNLVIQADNEAMELVRSAHKTKQMIEEKTHQERKVILEEAEEMRRALEAQVAEEQALELKKRQEKAHEEYADAHRVIREEMEENKENWAEEIYKNILWPPRV